MGFYDGKGYWRNDGDGYYDSKGYWHNPGEGHYDGKGNWRRQGEGAYDSKGYWRRPGEGGYDGKGYWRNADETKASFGTGGNASGSTGDEVFGLGAFILLVIMYVVGKAIWGFLKSLLLTVWMILKIILLAVAGIFSIVLIFGLIMGMYTCLFHLFEAISIVYGNRRRELEGGA